MSENEKLAAFSKIMGHAGSSGHSAVRNTRAALIEDYQKLENATNQITQTLSLLNLRQHAGDDSDDSPRFSVRQVNIDRAKF